MPDSPETLFPDPSAPSSIPALSIIPLGGVGEIGLNMTVLEYGDDIIVIDAGLMFPDAEMLGVDIVIPDFSYLLENRTRVRGVVITHAHEDHIGALPFLLQGAQGPGLRHAAYARVHQRKAQRARPRHRRRAHRGQAPGRGGARLLLAWSSSA